VAEREQFAILSKILMRFQSAGILEGLILIGSWCLYFYRLQPGPFGDLPAVRTLDVDFLIPRPPRSKNEADVPAILEEFGFTPTYHGTSGLVVYDHPELRLEFLIPELGRGTSGPVNVRNLHVNAQGIRYLNFLADHTLVVDYHGVKVRIPQPAAFALHKLIVSSRRTKKEKKQKDLESAVGLLELLLKDPQGKVQVRSILEKLPTKWRKTILAVSEKYFPLLNEFYFPE
jgi:hypothetical protein